MANNLNNYQSSSSDHPSNTAGANGRLLHHPVHHIASQSTSGNPGGPANYSELGAPQPHFMAGGANAPGYQMSASHQIGYSTQAATADGSGYVAAGQHPGQVDFDNSKVAELSDLYQIASMLQVPAQRQDGLELLANAIAKTPARKLFAEPHGSIPGGS